MKKQAIVYISVIAVLLCALLLLTYLQEDDPKSTQPSTVLSTTTAPATTTSPPVTTVPTDAATIPTEPTVGPTDAATIPTEPTVGPTEPKIDYIVPDQYPVYPEIVTSDYVFQPPTLPLPDDNAAEEEWIAFYYSLFTTRDSWYGKLLTSYYATPEAVNVSPFIHNGITNSGGPLTDAEKAFLKEQGYRFEMDTFRTTATELNALLQTYLGTTLETCKEVRTIPNTYFPETDSYYNSASSPVDGGLTGIISWRVQENGDHCVRYYVDWGSHKVSEVVLRRKNHYLQVVSNLPVDIDADEVMTVYAPADRPTIAVDGDLTQPVTLTVPAEDAPKDEWIRFFYGLLSTEGSIYNRALSHCYEDPLSISFGTMLDIFGTGCITKATEDEMKQLSGLQLPDGTSAYKIAKADLETILETYFTTTLLAYHREQLADDPYILYLEETECYYFSRSIRNYSITVSGILDCEKLNANDWQIRYVFGGNLPELGSLVLRWENGCFRVMSNQSSY